MTIDTSYIQIGLGILGSFLVGYFLYTIRKRDIWFKELKEEFKKLNKQYNFLDREFYGLSKDLNKAELILKTLDDLTSRVAKNNVDVNIAFEKLRHLEIPKKK